LSLDTFYDIVIKIANGQFLDPGNQHHPLYGKLAGKRDCHIAPDWVLFIQ